MQTRSLLGPGGSPSFANVTIAAGGTLDLYNTADQTTNYERLRADWQSNVAQLTAQFGGTGNSRNIRIGVTTGAGAATPTRYVEIGSTGITLLALSGTASASLVSIPIGSTLSAGTGTQNGFSIAPTINQSGTAGYTALDINPTETATGSGTKLLQRWAVGGSALAQIHTTGLFYANNIYAYNTLGIASALGNTGDVLLNRDAADTLALRRAANAQTFRVYNTYTDASNYRRWNLSWNTTTAIMQVVGAGTGTNGNLAVGNAALATGATVGYFMIPSSAGAPTGVPADIPTGQVALHFDSTNSKLYVYNGGWVSTAALT